MSDIRTRPSVGKRRGNQTQSLENELYLTLQKLAGDCQRIVSVRKDSRNIEESDVAYVRKVKHRSQSFSPVKEREKNDYPKFQYRQTSDSPPPQKKITERLLPLWKSILGQGLTLSYKKCQNCDKFGHKG